MRVNWSFLIMEHGKEFTTPRSQIMLLKLFAECSVIHGKLWYIYFTFLLCQSVLSKLQCIQSSIFSFKKSKVVNKCDVIWENHAYGVENYALLSCFFIYSRISLARSSRDLKKKFEVTEVRRNKTTNRTRFFYMTLKYMYTYVCVNDSRTDEYYASFC